MLTATNSRFVMAIFDSNTNSGVLPLNMPAFPVNASAAFAPVNLYRSEIRRPCYIPGYSRFAGSKFSSAA